MAAVNINVGAGDSEQGHYTITPGGHLASGGLYTVPVNGADEMTFQIVPDDGWLIGDVFVYGNSLDPTGTYPVGHVSSFTFTGLQSLAVPYTAGIFATVFQYVVPPPPPVKCSFPWGWVVLAGAAGLVTGLALRGKKK